MKIGFVGDVHGRMFHTLAVLATWQLKSNEKLDLIIQVGDLGAYPFPTQDMINSRFVLEDPTELDFSKFLNAKGILFENLLYIKNEINTPIYFIRGNHEDFSWLNEISKNNKITNIDRLNLFHYVVDGTVMKINDSNIAFLGGIETDRENDTSIKLTQYNKLFNYKEREIDILVTHDAPYGIGVNFKGQVQGSKKISSLIKKIQPRYHIAGHYHHLNGPRMYDHTTYLGLNVLVPPLRKDPLRRVQPGSIAILDTTLNKLRVLEDEWLTQFSTINFDFNEFIEWYKREV